MTAPLILLVATRNEGKLAEIRELLPAQQFSVVSLSTYPEISAVEETGRTFMENAELKAEAAWSVAREWTLGDDSGLEVEYLNGRPGIYSSRFAGPDASDTANNKELLRLMSGVPRMERKARFCCAMVLISPIGEMFRAEEYLEGLIIEEPSGSGGFGYDPLFYIPELGKTTAELASEEKNEISHRGKALRRILGLLRAETGANGA